MKSFIVFAAVIALAAAGHDRQDDKKEKRGVASGFYAAPAPVLAKSVGYGAPAVGYAGPVGYAGYAAGPVGYSGYAAPAFAGPVGYAGYAAAPVGYAHAGYAAPAFAGPVGYAGYAGAGPVGYAGHGHGYAAPLAVHDAVKTSAPHGYSNQIPAAAIRNVETVGVTKTITPVVTKTTTYNTHSEPALSVGRVEGYTQHAHGAPKFAPVQYNTQYSTYANPTVGVNGPVTYAGPAISQGVGVGVAPVAAAPVSAYAGQAIGLGGFGYAGFAPAFAGYSGYAAAPVAAAYKAAPAYHAASYAAPVAYAAPAGYGAPAVVSQHSYAAPAVTVTSKGGYH